MARHLTKATHSRSVLADAHYPKTDGTADESPRTLERHVVDDPDGRAALAPLGHALRVACAPTAQAAQWLAAWQSAASPLISR